MVQFGDLPFEPRVVAFAPGRTELAGNHTDHQGGRVIAASVSRGVEVCAAPTDDGVAHVYTPGFAPVHVEVAQMQPRRGEFQSTAGLVRGMIAQCVNAGVPVSGFEARVSTTLPIGGGLSSSAAFELALGQALFALFAPEPAGPFALARMGQQSEKCYFGKPCGLMDQLSIALGGIVGMDFAREDEPVCTNVGFDFEASGWAVILVDVGADHSDCTDDYARIAADMRQVACLLGGSVLRDVPRATFFDALGDVRRQAGDGAVLRALHFYNEMDLTDVRLRALGKGDMQAFLDATRRSGASSAQYLRNVVREGDAHQPAMMALALADSYLGARGASRIHGGGFGGTIQAFVPIDAVLGFVSFMEKHLGEGCAQRVVVSSEGAHARRI